MPQASSPTKSPMPATVLDNLKSSWPFWASSLILLIWVAITCARVIRINDGRLIYALDDAYIHTAIAKNIVQHGLWGVTPYEWSSSSSSPLWTIVLSASFLIAGVRDWIPLALNIACSLGVLWVANLLLRREGVSRWGAFAVLLALIALLPLPTLILTGMEHPLHILLILLVVKQALPMLAASGRVRWLSRESLLLLVLVMLAMAARYESIFVIAIIGGLFYISRRPVYPILLAAAAAVPVVLYAVISTAQGAMIMPNSLHLKSGATRVFAGDRPLGQLSPDFMFEMFRIEAVITVLALLLLATIILRARRTGGMLDRAVLITLIALGSSFLHVIALGQGGISWDTRYKAYVITLLIVALGAASQGLIAPRVVLSSMRTWAGARIAPVMALVILLASVPLIKYAITNQTLAFRGSHEIYIQQVQMARFLDVYYAGETVAINDLGAVSYYAQSRLIDLIGLGNNEYTRGLLTGQFSQPEYLATLDEKDLRIAVIYERWLLGNVPPGWVRVATWNYGETVVVGNKVTFFATSAEEAARLRQNLMASEDALPGEVTVEYESGD
jgi:hypothetical protein